MSASKKVILRRAMAMKAVKPLTMVDLSSRISVMRAKIVEVMVRNIITIENPP